MRTHSRYRPRIVTLRDGRQVTLRAIQPGDKDEIAQAFERLSAESRYLRFMQHKKALDSAVVDRGVNPVPGREYAFVATVSAADGFDIVGGARYVDSGKPDTCEFAITVLDEWTKRGLGTALLRSLMRRAKYDGYRTMEGVVLAANEAMLALARHLHFEVVAQADDPKVVLIRRAL